MAAKTRPPEVYNMGGAYEDTTHFVDAEAITAGDLIRITTSGTVKLADAASAGAVHGIALETGTTGGDPIKVLLFTPETVLKIQTYGTVAPADLTKGVAYTLNVTAGKHSVTSTTTNGVAIVVGYGADDVPWTGPNTAFGEASATDNNCVLVRFSAATLDGYAAA